MDNLRHYLTARLNKSFKIAFTLIFIILNVVIILVNTVYINRTLNQQNDSLVEMVEHLLNYTDEATTITYLEHFSHTHAVYISFTTEDGRLMFESFPEPDNGKDYNVSVDGLRYGSIVIDNAQSSLFLTNLMYIFIVNVVIVSLYIFSIIFLNRKLGKGLGKVLFDLERLNIAIKTLDFKTDYTFEDLYKIAQSYEYVVSDMRRLQKSHNDQIQALAHDIKTPLTIIQGYIEGISKKRIEINDAIRTSITAEVDRMSLSIQRIIEGGETIQFDKLSLNDIIEKIVIRYRPLMDRKNIRLDLKLKNNTELFGDSVQLERMIDHVLQNSLNAMDNAGVIRITLSNDPLYLEICDEGKGIPKSRLKQLFIKSDSQDGTGVGLKIVKNIADLHQAKLDVESEIDKGTCIKISFHS